MQSSWIDIDAQKASPWGMRPARLLEWMLHNHFQEFLVVYPCEYRYRDRSYMIENEFSRLFSPHIKVLYRVAYQWTLNPGDAEELVQELASKLVGRVNELKTIQRLKPWLIKVMYRLFVDLYRRKKLSPVVFEHSLGDNQPENLAFASKESEPESAVYLAEIRKSLLIALKKLEPKQASAIFLFEVEGFSIREIAELQGVSEGTVKSRLFRARAALQKLILPGTFTDFHSCMGERTWE